MLTCGWAEWGHSFTFFRFSNYFSMSGIAVFAEAFVIQCLKWDSISQRTETPRPPTKLVYYLTLPFSFLGCEKSRSVYIGLSLLSFVSKNYDIFEDTFRSGAYGILQLPGSEICNLTSDSQKATVRPPDNTKAGGPVPGSGGNGVTDRSQLSKWCY